MENESNKISKIPFDYFEILQFIKENKQQILDDWHLLFEIIHRLDELLKTASSMGELHKDTRIILETIKIQQDAFIKELRKELTLEKLVTMAGSDFLEDFFSYIKANSQKMNFIDQLNFNYTLPESAPRKERSKYDDAKGEAKEPETLDHIDEETETNALLQKIKNTVLKFGEVEFFKLIIDPSSYSKSVINAFNLALAVRMKMVSFKMNCGVLYVTLYDSGNQELNHSVLEITPEQYEKLLDKMYNK